METFDALNLTKPLQNAIADLGFDKPTPIQKEACPLILSGKDMVGIAQTGTGKTIAYLLPILKDLKFSKQLNPRVLILVPTRELVLQLVDNINSLTEYMSVRALGLAHFGVLTENLAENFLQVSETKYFEWKDILLKAWDENPTVENLTLKIKNYLVESGLPSQGADFMSKREGKWIIKAFRNSILK